MLSCPRTTSKASPTSPARWNPAASSAGQRRSPPDHALRTIRVPDVQNQAHTQPVSRHPASLGADAGLKGVGCPVCRALFIAHDFCKAFQSVRPFIRVTTQTMSFFSVDMRVLRSFISVVETGSVTETARRLGRTQPAITLHIKRLEVLHGKNPIKHEPGRHVLTSPGS